MKKIYFALLCLSSGSAWLVIKIGLGYFPPFTYATIRFGVATLAAYTVLLWQNKSISQCWNDLAGPFWFGIFSGISYALLFWGEQFVSSGLASIINATLPLFALFFACLLFTEKFSATKGIGLIIGLAGVMMAFSYSLVDADRSSIAGEIALLVSAAVYAFGAVLAKRYEQALGLMEWVTVQMGVTTLVVSVPALVLERGQAFYVNFISLISMLYLALVCSVGYFLLYFFLLKQMEVSRLSYISIIAPVIAVFLGTWWRDEPLRWEYLIGLTLIMFGVWIVNQKRFFWLRCCPGESQDGK